MHQKIRPQTKTPTVSAAIAVPVHMSYIALDCTEMPLGHPKAKAFRNEQPDRRVTVATATSPRAAIRPALRVLRAVGRAPESFATTWLLPP